MTELAEALFGSVVRVHATGDHSPDPQKLYRDLITEGDLVCVLHGFCRGCGMHLQVTAKGFRASAPEMAIPDAETHYLELTGCNYCDGEPKTGVVREKPCH